MKSKKFLSTRLAVAICILAFAGCNKQQEGVMQGESSNSSKRKTAYFFISVPPSAPAYPPRPGFPGDGAGPGAR